MVDTSQLLPFSSGAILSSQVKAVKRGAPGEAGELRGQFELDRDAGQLRANTERGIFGTAEPDEDWDHPEAALPVASRREIHPGAAKILANVQGDAVEEYRVEIREVCRKGESGRDFVLSITDPKLLAVTGGIVQGMSGSPVIQNGKLVGAVTHVLLNDPTRGYGISMETMLDAAE